MLTVVFQIPLAEAANTPCLVLLGAAAFSMFVLLIGSPESKTTGKLKTE
jgi:hypothetical protein